MAEEGGNPRHLRWERCGDGWGARGITVAHARHTPPRPWSQVGSRPGSPERCRRCGDQYVRAVVDVTASLGPQCADCQGYGCFGCGWNGRHDQR